MKTKDKPMNFWKLTSLVLFVLLVAVVAGAFVMLSAPAGYTVVMSNCGGDFALMGGHIASFANLDEAQLWADESLSYQYDNAAIYTLDAPNRLSELLWFKSDGNCYEGQYSQWTALESQ
jgi:hypothetical protein